MLLANAFSLNMLPLTQPLSARMTPLTLEEARAIFAAECLESAVGHATTAAILSQLLDREVPVARQTITFPDHGGALVVAQYTGPRLPEGATTLPDGAQITWVLVRTWPAWWGE